MNMNESPSIYPEDYCWTDEAEELREIRESRYITDDEFDEVDEYCSYRISPIKRTR